jgi:hypothetical protein
MKNVEPGTGHAVVHFWLCAKCSAVYTLEFREKSGTAVLRLKNPSAKPNKRTATKDHLAVAAKATTA